MTTRTLSGIYTSAYNLYAPVTTLSITAAGYLGGGLVSSGTGTYTIVNAGGIYGAGYGVSLVGPATMTNTGTIRSGATGFGAYLRAGGSIANAAGAVIAGDYGVAMSGLSGAVTNNGTIEAGAVGVLFLGVSGSVNNQGLVRAIGTTGAGVSFGAGGAATNGGATNTGAVIDGVDGVKAAGGAATVRNFGTILGHASTLASTYGVVLSDGGAVVNGSAQVTTALIEGPTGVVISTAAGTVTNFGTIVGDASGHGIELQAGGTIVNGSEADTSALIRGAVEETTFANPSTIVNFGTIAGGAVFEGAGGLTNGSDTDTTALIQGRFGVVGEKAAVTVRNFGTIRSGFYQQLLTEGVVLVFGGSVTNGDASDTTALIQGLTGVYIANAIGTVTNFGTITDTALGGGRGVYLYAGQITNGSATDTGALIRGHAAGAYVARGAGAIINFGTIRGAVTSGVGASLAAGGRILNGSDADRTALITGFHGVAAGSGTVINNGTIAGDAAVGSYGLLLGPGGAATNGSATNAAALITGYYGAALSAGATLTNFGTVRAGASGYAVEFYSATARLNAEAGSVFEGTVTAGGAVDVVSGTATMTAIQTNGFVEGPGTLELAGGASIFFGGAKLSVAQILEAGAGTNVEIAATLTDAKVFTQTGGTLTVDEADRINFSGVGDSFAGTLTGNGAVAFTGGSDTLAGGVVLSAASMIISTATVTLSGAISLTKTLSATTAHLIVAAGGATLSGGGILALTNNAANAVTGATAGATLTNLAKITGAGALGGGLMTLANQAGGVINGNVSTALVIDTGAATIINAGVIESTSTGGVTIKSAVANAGSLTVTAGVLTLQGAVTGAGTVRIGGGTADVATSTFSENVTFTSTTGILELANSQGYAGKISGFSKTGTTSLDLLDIAFGGSTTAKFSGTATSGVLTVTDGAHTAKITLTGDYTASTFTPTSDGHGGTTVVDPTAAPTGRTPPMSPLVTAMAVFGAGGAAPAAHMPEAWRTSPPSMLSTRAA